MPIRLPRSAALLALVALVACDRVQDRGDYPALLPIDEILDQAGVDPLPPAPPPDGFAAP